MSDHIIETPLRRKQLVRTPSYLQPPAPSARQPAGALAAVQSAG